MTHSTTPGFREEPKQATGGEYHYSNLPGVVSKTTYNKKGITKDNTVSGNVIDTTDMAQSLFHNKIDHANSAFVIMQLKKVNRDLKLQGQEKDKMIDDLRQSVRMSRVEELEHEMLQYMQECGRLRS